MKAVHFGAGNIGRGFIGSVLQDSGYHVVFADVNSEIVDQLNSSGKYSVIELGDGGHTHVYKNFTAINSLTHPAELISEISTADVITASVGVNLLPRIAEAISKGLMLRTSSKPVVVMACENAVNASDVLAHEILTYSDVSKKAVFLNTAVDRIVPQQSHSLSPDVEVEAFSEWVIETKNLVDPLPIPAAIQVPDLGPFIERKLFTVNTGHCAVAYFGQHAGYPTVASAMQDSAVYSQVEKVLEETSKALILKYAFNAKNHQEYVDKTLNRLSNEVIDDQVERVGRQPLRKLSRFERLISPAAYLAENGIYPSALLSAVAAALSFFSEDDREVTQMNQLLLDKSAEEFVKSVCGIYPGHPLFDDLVAAVSQRQAEATAA